MKTIVRITECAGRYLKRRLLALARSPKQYLRLVPAPGGLAGLVLDEIRDEDQVIRLNGEPLLVLSPVLVPTMNGATLDCVAAGEGPRLSLTKWVDLDIQWVEFVLMVAQLCHVLPAGQSPQVAMVTSMICFLRFVIGDVGAFARATRPWCDALGPWPV